VRDVPHKKNGVADALSYLKDSAGQIATTAQRRAA